jgi:hypothetical protein
MRLHIDTVLAVKAKHLVEMGGLLVVFSVSNQPRSAVWSWLVSWEVLGVMMWGCFS